MLPNTWLFVLVFTELFELSVTVVVVGDVTLPLLYAWLLSVFVVVVVELVFEVAVVLPLSVVTVLVLTWLLSVFVVVVVLVLVAVLELLPLFWLRTELLSLLSE